MKLASTTILGFQDSFHLRPVTLEPASFVTVGELRVSLGLKDREIQLFHTLSKTAK